MRESRKLSQFSDAILKLRLPITLNAVLKLTLPIMYSAIDATIIINTTGVMQLLSLK